MTGTGRWIAARFVAKRATERKSAEHDITHPPRAAKPPAQQPVPKRDGDWRWIPLRNEWRDVRGKPEELVRQDFIVRLVT